MIYRMQLSLARALAFALLLFALAWSSAFGQPAEAEKAPNQNTAAGPVALRVVQARPRVDAPWLPAQRSETRALGMDLGDFILTDLDVVRYAKAIEVRRGGQWSAVQLRHAGVDCGLALLAPAAGGEQAVGLRTVGELPAPGSNIRAAVFGGAVAGEASDALAVLATYRGSITALAPGSDTDFITEAQARVEGQTTERIAAFGGAPIFSGETFIGVARWSDAANLSFTAPEIVRRFLKDIDDGAYDGVLRSGIAIQSAAHPALRRWLRLGQRSEGAFAVRIEFGSPAWSRLQAGDVILKAGGDAVNAEGLVQTADGLLSMDRRYAMATTALPLQILRAGEELSIELPRSSYNGPAQMRRSLEGRRPYFLGGGLVFQELDYELIHDYPSPAPLLHYRYRYFTADLLNQEVDRDVVLSHRLVDAGNIAAESFVGGVLHSINGRRVRNLRDLASEWRSLRTTRVSLRFLDRADLLVLSRDQLSALDRRIAARYQPQESGRVR